MDADIQKTDEGMVSKIRGLSTKWDEFYKLSVQDLIVENSKVLNSTNILPIRQWIEKNIYLPIELMGSGNAGFFSFEDCKYLIPVVEWLEPACDIEEVFVDKCRQSCVTTLSAAYLIQQGCQTPEPAIYYNASEDSVRIMISQKTDPLIDACSVARTVFSSKRSPDGANSDKEKSGIGFTHYFLSAGTPKSFAGPSAKTIICDELARYPQTNEGDSYLMISGRGTRFRGKGLKMLSFTTCRNSDDYVLKHSVNATHYRMKTKCPNCGTFEELVLEGIAYVCPFTGEWKKVHDTDLRGDQTSLVEGFFYEFSCCKHRISDDERIKMNRDYGNSTQLFMTKEGEKKKVCIKITYMMTSVIDAMGEIARAYIGSWELNKKTGTYNINYNTRQTIWNQMLSLPYDENKSSVVVDTKYYYKYRNPCSKEKTLPRGTYLITVGIDTQKGLQAGETTEKSWKTKPRIELVYLAHVKEYDENFDTVREKIVVIDREIIHGGNERIIMEQPATYERDLLDALNRRFVVSPDCPISNPSFFENINTLDQYISKKETNITPYYYHDAVSNTYTPKHQFLKTGQIATMGVNYICCDFQGDQSQTAGLFRFYVENHPANERVTGNGYAESTMSERGILEKFLFVQGGTPSKRNKFSSELIRPVKETRRLQSIAENVFNNTYIEIAKRERIANALFSSLMTGWVSKVKEIFLNPYNGLVHREPCLLEFAQNLTDDDIQGFFSEERISFVNKKGIENDYEYHPVSGIRNEVLDCCVYAYLAKNYFVASPEYKDILVRIEKSRKNLKSLIENELEKNKKQ
jgi:hypothetical protein